MGCKLYVAKKYVVEYSSYGEFNWQQEEFRTLMEALEIELCADTGGGELWSFEVSKKNWERGMEILKSTRRTKPLTKP